MRISAKFCIIILVVAAAALILRLPRLSLRPMHTDEAVHAEKFGELLEGKNYRYDPYEYHGPTLNYLTLIPAWLSGAETYSDITEVTLRIVPVVFGVLLIILLLFVTDALTPVPIIISAVLTAVCPAMVFYSRYYIQEMLLVCFTFGVIVSGWRYSQKRSIGWAITAGVFIGLMHATKETCVIALCSMVIALLIILLINRKRTPLMKTLKSISGLHIIIMILSAAVVSASFYSSFLTNPSGILDSIRTYITYIDRAGQNDWHLHPWYYYLKNMIYYRFADGPVFTNGIIILLAIAGFAASFAKKLPAGINITFIRFLSLYTLITTIIYSAIHYKTPWCMLSFLHGMILLAGVGAVVFVSILPRMRAKIIASVLIAAAMVHLFGQSMSANYIYYYDSRNPYVYAHTSRNIFTVVDKLNELADIHPDGKAMPIEIICPGDDYWPFPWYLRSFTKVAYLSAVNPDLPPAPVIIAAPEVETELMHRLYELQPTGKKNLYMHLFDSYMELRPQLELRGYITKELWDEYQRDIFEKSQVKQKRS